MSISGERACGLVLGRGGGKKGKEERETEGWKNGGIKKRKEEEGNIQENQERESEDIQEEENVEEKEV